MWIFSDFCINLLKKQVIQSKIFIFTVTNDYITWPCRWFCNLSHMFSLLACVSHSNNVFFSCGIKSDVSDKTSHAYSCYSKVTLCCNYTLREYFSVLWCSLLFQMNKLNVFAGFSKSLWKSLKIYNFQKILWGTRLKMKIAPW